MRADKISFERLRSRKQKYRTLSKTVPLTRLHRDIQFPFDLSSTDVEISNLIAEFSETSHRCFFNLFPFHFAISFGIDFVP